MRASSCQSNFTDPVDDRKDLPGHNLCDNTQRGRMLQTFKTFLKDDESGATAIEYGLICAGLG